MEDREDFTEALELSVNGSPNHEDSLRKQPAEKDNQDDNIDYMKAGTYKESESDNN